MKLKRTVTLTLGAVLLLIAAAVFSLQATGDQVLAQSSMTDGADTTRTVHVSGDGQINAVPDVAVVTLGVETDAESASEALAQNSEQAQALIDALEEADVPAGNIQTQQIQLQPRYQETPPPEPVAGSNDSTSAQPPAAAPVNQRQLVGYTAINTVEVRVTELDSLGDLLDAAVQAGGNRIDGIRFEVSASADLLDQAREAAWADATHKAEQLAELAGASLGQVLTVNDSSRTPFPVARNVGFEAAAAVPVEPGSQTVEVHLDVTWTLQEQSMEEPAEPSVQVSPESGPPGTELSISASGFPANTEVTVGLGVANAEPSEEQTVTTDADGNLSTTLTLPGEAESGEVWRVLVLTEDGAARALSADFTVAESS